MLFCLLFTLKRLSLPLLSVSINWLDPQMFCFTFKECEQLSVWVAVLFSEWFAFLLLYSEWLSNHCTREILDQVATNVYFIFFNVVMVSCLCSVANLVYNYIILRLKVTVNTFLEIFLNIFKSKKIRGSTPLILLCPLLLRMVYILLLDFQLRI